MLEILHDISYYKNMTPNNFITTDLIIAIVTLFGIIISVTLSFFINKYQNKIELLKIQSGFNEQLYSERMKAYLVIYELISAFVKTIFLKMHFHRNPGRIQMHL